MRFQPILKEVADALASGRSMAGANFGREKNTKVSLAGALHKWPEHLKKWPEHKWLGNLKKDTSEKIT